MQLLLATFEDSPIVEGVLSTVAANLRARVKELWSATDVSALAVSPHINEGLYHLAFEGNAAVGVFRLQTKDPVFWPEIPAGTSVYLHKLAVLPEKQGQGLAHTLLRHAVDLTRVRGFGFRHHSQKLLGGHVFECFELDVRALDA